MEAPEKIYLIRNFSTPTALNTTNDHHGKFLNEWYKSREKAADIEYIRKDAFIEKACEGIKHLLSGYIIKNFNFGNSYEIDTLIEDFKKYMEKKKL